MFCKTLGENLSKIIEFDKFKKKQNDFLHE